MKSALSLAAVAAGLVALACGGAGPTAVVQPAPVAVNEDGGTVTASSGGKIPIVGQIVGDCNDLLPSREFVTPGGIYLWQGLPAENQQLSKVFAGMADLLRALVQAGAGPLRDYAIHLLSQFDAEPHGITAAKEKVTAAGDPLTGLRQALIEPLSPRELEVLQLIALGRSNQEIALQLIVSPGTVKAHSASIYRKLDVANRTEAVARARQLGILR